MARSFGSKLGNIFGDIASVPLRAARAVFAVATSNPYMMAVSAIAAPIGFVLATTKQGSSTPKGSWAEGGANPTAFGKSVTAKLRFFAGGINRDYRDWTPSWLQILGPLDKTPHYATNRHWAQWFKKIHDPRDIPVVGKGIEEAIWYLPQTASSTVYGALMGWKY